MKVAIIFVVALSVATAEHIFEKCHDTSLNLPELKPINLQKMMGLWYDIRKGPFGPYAEKTEKIDCVGQAVWKEYGGPENELTLLLHVRKEKMHHFTKTIKFNVVPLGNELYENNFTGTKEVTLPGKTDKVKMSFQDKLIDSDEGKSWSLWAACIQKGDGNATVVWSVKSRYPKMDARLEQTLVEKVEKYGGVGPSQLRGVGQTDCY